MLEDRIKPINHVLEHYLDQWKRGLLLCLELSIEVSAGPSPLLLLYSIITRAGGRGGEGRGQATLDPSIRDLVMPCLCREAGRIDFWIRWEIDVKNDLD